ncbi:hypothetical protein EFA59_03590 [Weissella hellenica]|nr:hypothetical protein EFA59_03590 [Weissella hellenica]
MKAENFENNNLEVLIDLLKMNNGFPKPFVQAKNSYFVYESISNLTAQGVHHVLSSKKIINNYLMNETSRSDISLFLDFKWDDVNDIEKTNLYNETIELARNEVHTPLINNIIEKNDREKLPYKQLLQTQYPTSVMAYSIPPELEGMTEQEIYEKRMDLWVIDLTSRKFDKSEMILFLTQFRISSFDTIGKHMDGINLNDLCEFKHPDQIVLAYLSQKSIFHTPLDWLNDIGNKLIKFSPKSFIRFWKTLGYVQVTRNYGEYKIPKKIPDYANDGFDEVPANETVVQFIRDYFLKNNIKFID